MDEKISQELFDHLAKNFPKDAFCSEESAETNTPIPIEADFTWVLDPVDGTNNYAVGVPECCISLGLLRKGIPVYGFIYDYGRDNLLQGGPLVGSIEGNRSVQASPQLVNEKLTFCMHFPIPTSDLDALREVLQEWRIRCPGSAAVGWQMWLLADWMDASSLGQSLGTVQLDMQFAKDQVPDLNL